MAINNSKKKTTMTLKDFHGGSIPSDLPLPSAPGLTIRPPDRPAARPRPPVRTPPFLPNPTHIGRNFDEDERKPFDASANPRRAPDPDPLRPSQLSTVSASKTANYPAPMGPGQFPNAWGVSVSKAVKEDFVPVREWSATRIAQTSAVEKVLSGMWQSKLTNVEDSCEIERPRSGSDFVGNRDLRGAVGSGLGNGGARPVSAEGRFVVTKGVSEVQERPKLKLFPRTKQMEFSDGYGQVFEEKQQVYQRSVSAIEVNAAKEMHGSGNAFQVIDDEGSRAVERPKLNLKPRTQPVEQPNFVSVKERKMVFGGARPRELVLKERGIDVPNEPDLIVQPNRNDIPKSIDSKSETPMTNQPGDRGNFSLGQKAGRDDKRGLRPDADKIDATRASWRNDTRKNTREIEKPPEQQRADVVDNWRKPVEPPKPESSGLRFGKAASPLELAQAFSRSGSESNSDSHGANERNLPGRSQVPFTRLTDKREFYPRSAQKQINGY